MEFIGRNSIINLKDIVKGKVLLFTQLGIYSIFETILNRELQKTLVTIFDKITENPKRDEIQKAQDTLKNQDFDYIIAFGGGSVIDFAKAFRFYSKRKSPLIAIPTTAGTGSQATQFAVVYIDGVKTSLDNHEILPNFVIADSQFVENAPTYLKACSAIDAYCQAIESFWAVKSTEESKKYSLEAITICKDYIIEAVNTNNKKANEMMVRAAHLAGKAINISRTTAAHALSYKITSEYGIPHGHAVALSMVDLMNANSLIDDETCLDPRGSSFVKCQITFLLSLITNNRLSFTAYWRNLMDKLSLEWRFRKLHIIDKDKIFNSVNIQRLNNNPKNLKNDLINFYKV